MKIEPFGLRNERPNTMVYLEPDFRRSFVAIALPTHRVHVHNSRTSQDGYISEVSGNANQLRFRC